MWFLLITAIMLLLSSRIVNKKIYYPTTVFCFAWTIVLSLLCIQIYDIEIEERSFFIIFIMLLAFPLGSFIAIGLRKRKHIINNAYSDEESRFSNKYVLRKGLFFALCIFSIAILLIDEISIIHNVISGNSFYYILRETGGAQTVEISGIKGLMYLFIVYPLSYCVSPVCAIEIIAPHNSAREKILLGAINFLFIFLSAMHHGARLLIVLGIFTYLCVFKFYDKKINLSKKVKRRLYFMIAIAVSTIVWLSLSRGIENIFGSFYIYFICEFPVMENFLNSTVYSRHTFGYLSLNGFFYPVMQLLKIIGIQPPEVYNYTQEIRRFLETFIYIEKYGHTVNSFLPAGAYVYIDGGYVLEFIGILVTGILSQKVFDNFEKIKNCRNMYIMVFALIGVFFSFFRFYFTSYHYALGLLYVFILYRPNTGRRIRVKFRP